MQITRSTDLKDEFLFQIFCEFLFYREEKFHRLPYACSGVDLVIIYNHQVERSIDKHTEPDITKTTKRSLLHGPSDDSIAQISTRKVVKTITHVNEPNQAQLKCPIRHEPATRNTRHSNDNVHAKRLARKKRSASRVYTA